MRNQPICNVFIIQSYTNIISVLNLIESNSETCIITINKSLYYFLNTLNINDKTKIIQIPILTNTNFIFLSDLINILYIKIWLKKLNLNPLSKIIYFSNYFITYESILLNYFLKKKNTLYLYKYKNKIITKSTIYNFKYYLHKYYNNILFGQRTNVINTNNGLINFFNYKPNYINSNLNSPSDELLNENHYVKIPAKFIIFIDGDISDFFDPKLYLEDLNKLVTVLQKYKVQSDEIMYKNHPTSSNIKLNINEIPKHIPANFLKFEPNAILFSVTSASLFINQHKIYKVSLLNIFGFKVENQKDAFERYLKNNANDILFPRNFAELINLCFNE